MNPLNEVQWGHDWAWGVPLIALNVVIHVLCLAIFTARTERLLGRYTDHRRFSLTFALVMGVAVTVVTCLHLLEAAIWALIFSWWPNYARLSRMIARDILAQKYIASADALGVSALRKVFRYVLPNAFDVLVIQVTLDVAAVMLASSSGVSFACSAMLLSTAALRSARWRRYSCA